MMLRHEVRNAVWFTSSILDDGNTQSYPQDVENTVEKPAAPCGEPLGKRLDNRIRHGFSTRYGGVSQDPYLSDLNFGFSVGEDRKTTLENYRLFAETLGIAPAGLLCANQTHTTRVLTVGHAHRGMGLTVPPETVLDDKTSLEEGYDGFVTRDAGVALVVRTADCVPILFADPQNHVIGACHAGWRGTVGGIAAEVVEKMVAIGAQRSQIRAAIGHAVGVCCYEVDDAFYETFRSALGDTICEQIFEKSNLYEHPEKWHCDLRLCNRLLLLGAGLSDDHIDTSERCTCCHPELFHSHRYAVRHNGGRRGLMAAVISIIGE